MDHKLFARKKQKMNLDCRVIFPIIDDYNKFTSLLTDLEEQIVLMGVPTPIGRSEKSYLKQYDVGNSSEQPPNPSKDSSPSLVHKNLWIK